MSDADPVDEIVLPVLLGWARRTYGSAIRTALADAGFDDMPRRGSFVLGSLARGGVAQQNFEIGLGVTKQAASQLIDTLVLRGYVERRPDQSDRRRTIVTLTARGEAAAATSRAAVEHVDALLAARATPDEVAAARKVLVILCDPELAPAADS